MKNNQIEKSFNHANEKKNMIHSNEFLELKKFFEDIKQYDEYIDQKMNLNDVVLSI